MLDEKKQNLWFCGKANDISRVVLRGSVGSVVSRVYCNVFFLL